jgi:dTDP-3-amino-3,4,6-trideoxy-alpha-D-glucose transaminase
LNSRLDELHAAILHDALMPLITKFTKRRKEIASRYCSEINNPLILIPPKPEGSESVWHLFPILIKGNRRLFQNYLTRESIAFGIHYPILIPDQKALNNTVGGQLLTPLRNALFFADQEISLPIHPYLTEQQIEQIIYTCNVWKG